MYVKHREHPPVSLGQLERNKVVPYNVVNFKTYTRHLMSFSAINHHRTSTSSLVLRLLCGGGGKRAWYTLFVDVPSW